MTGFQNQRVDVHPLVFNLGISRVFNYHFTRFLMHFAPVILALWTSKYNPWGFNGHLAGMCIFLC